MTTQHAACSCGQLHLTVDGEPLRISMCSCLACQRRTGAVISNQARFRREQVTLAGKATTWMRTAESDHALTFHFCPICGSTLYWENDGFPGTVSVAIGNFADPHFPRADHRGVGGITPPLGLLAARHATQARGEAGVIDIRRASAVVVALSALPPKADMCSAAVHVRFGPEADMTTCALKCS